MKIFIKYIIGGCVIMLLTLISSCSENYLIFDTAYNGIYFTKDTLKYSFGITPVETTTHTFNIPVAIMGTTSKEMRSFAYEILPDSTNATEGVHYSIGNTVIMPDSIVGYIPITIYRDKLEGNHIEGYTQYKLCLQLVGNDSFTPTLDSLHQVRIFRFDNSIDQPEWYNVRGEKVWQKSYLGEWHPYKFIKMVEYFHEIENILPETYKKMVVLYGKDLEHIPLGDPYQYRTVFIKYIYSPMYDFFNDPNNREDILSRFPNFIFDFPDPYAGA